MKATKSLECIGLSFLSFFGFKTVSNSSQGDDVWAVFSEIFPQKLDVCVKSSVISEEIITPDIADKLFSRQRNTAVFDKIKKQIVLFRGEVDVFAVDGHDTSREIDF